MKEVIPNRMLRSAAQLVSVEHGLGLLILATDQGIIELAINRGGAEILRNALDEFLSIASH